MHTHTHTHTHTSTHTHTHTHTCTHASTHTHTHTLLHFAWDIMLAICNRCLHVHVVCCDWWCWVEPLWKILTLLFIQCFLTRPSKWAEHETKRNASSWHGSPDQPHFFFKQSQSPSQTNVYQGRQHRGANAPHPKRNINGDLATPKEWRIQKIAKRGSICVLSRCDLKTH